MALLPVAVLRIADNKNIRSTTCVNDHVETGSVMCSVMCVPFAFLHFTMWVNTILFSSRLPVNLISKAISLCGNAFVYLCLPPTGSGDVLFFPVRLSVRPSVCLSVCPSQIVSAL